MGKFIESCGFKWYLDDELDDTIAVYDNGRFLNYEVRTPDGRIHPKIIPMFENDEVVIKINKVD